MKDDAIIRLLVVEDNEERIEFFRSAAPADIQCLYVRSAGRAIGTLELDRGHVYAGILIDHDLNESATIADELAFDGVNVIEKIIESVSRDIPILIHSMNFKGATEMYRKLSSAGFAVTRVPFSKMTEKLLLDWIDEVRSEYEYRQS